MSARVAALVAVTSASGAWAEEHPRAHLVYSRLAGAEACPDPAALESAVTARLGYSPFDSTSVTVITATFRGAAQGLEAVVDFGSQGNRKLSSPARDCQELASAAALAISIAIDPLSLTRVAPAPVEPAPPPPPKVEERRAPPAPPPAPSPLQVAIAVGALASLASAPQVAPGFTVGARVKWPSFSIAAEGRFDVPVRGRADAGVFETSVLLGSLVPCFHKSWFAACAVASGGVLRAAGIDLADAQRVTLPFFGAGARAQVELALGSMFFVRPHLEVLAVFTRAALSIGQVEVWVSPPVFADAGLSAGLVFQ